MPKVARWLCIVLCFACAIPYISAQDIEPQRLGEIIDAPDSTRMAQPNIFLADSLAAMTADTVPAKKPGFFKRLFAGLTEGHIDRTHEKAIDLSFVAFPSYSNEPGFGIGAALTGFFRINRQDSILPPSDVFVSVNATFRAFFQVYFKGNVIFPNGRSRLGYVISLYRMPLDFWGITATEAKVNPKSKYDRLMADIQVNYLHMIKPGFYLGAKLRSNYTGLNSIQNPEYLHDEAKKYYCTGLGFIIEYDTRDNLLNPSSGIHISYSPMVFPNFLGTQPKTFWNNTFYIDYYHKLWPHAIGAFDLYGGFNTEGTPWTMREQANADGIRLRGYYMGRDIYNNQITAQIEIRQHIYKRLGATVWGGVGAFFNKFSDFKKGGRAPVWLPNWGLGLRFEIKHNANVRLDFGFAGKDLGIMFAFGEAF